MATLFDGNALAEQIKQNVRLEVESIRRQLSSFRPKFIAIAVGEHPASRIYLERKKEAATVSGIDCDIINIPSNASEDSLLRLIKDINADVSISGLIVQLPLPNHMSEIRICNAVIPSKDVDGFTQTNLGRTFQDFGQTGMIPCTVLAVRKIIEKIGRPTHGLNCVVIGRSHNVGLPIAVMLGADKLNGGFDMTPTLCHRYTPPSILVSACQGAHLVVSAAGVPELVTPDMVMPGATVIDVGLTRKQQAGTGKNVVVGDVDRRVKQVAGVLTPVPGGVGPCTVACLMVNTLLAAKTQAGIIGNTRL